MEKYKGVYDKRLVGLYNGKFVYHNDSGEYVIEGYNKSTRRVSVKELKEINEKFGNLEKKVREFRII